MTVYFDKRRQRWCFDFVMKGERHFGYCIDAEGKPVSSRRAAEQSQGVAKRKASIEPKLMDTRSMTLGQVVADLLPLWQRQAHWPNTKRYLRELLAFFGPMMPIAEIDDGRIRDYITRSRVEGVLSWRGGPSRDPKDPQHARFWIKTSKPRGPATINLYLGPLRQALERATKMRDPVSGQPVLERAPIVPELAVPRRKARPVPDSVLSDLITKMPAHVVDAIMLTLFFGFRKGEVFGLKRHNIDFEASGVRLFAESVKDAEDTFLPGSPMAMGYLRCLDMEAEERHVDNLITWRRPRKDAALQASEPWRAITDPHAAWSRAQKIMEETFGRRFRWHDLRAAFITQVAMTSGQLAAQALARHSDYNTTRAYVEVADELRRAAADRASDRPALRAIK